MDYRIRYYSPNLRRFIEPDPIGFEGGMNLYAYVGNDPGNALDPLGLQEEGIGFGNMHALRNFSNSLSSTHAMNEALRRGKVTSGPPTTKQILSTGRDNFVCYMNDRGQAVIDHMQSDMRQSQLHSLYEIATFSVTTIAIDDSDLGGMGGVISNVPLSNRYVFGIIAVTGVLNYMFSPSDSACEK